MREMPFYKYKPYEPVPMADRVWPSLRIERPPIWCSVDLRDGNQALIDPMSVSEKLEMFRLLLRIGFKEIEVAFPSASQTEFEFVRLLVEEDLIPDEVTIQVLTQAKEHLIRRTFEAIKGAKRAIVHLYNSTSELQRRVVFQKDRKEIIQLAVEGTRIVKEEAANTGTEIIYEYSPESFTGTELDFAREICEAVGDLWQPTPERRIIVNLPATVEMSTPNIYADMIEWFSRNVGNKASMILSIHPHNDRGTAVAATELALLGGAERVEGTLFGNGERTGNVDVITLALNMHAQGIDPGLDLRDINGVIELSERCTKIPVHVRHPYAGELVYTAFSGSHQDAISKGMKRYAETKQRYWEVPYLPIDPEDVGRNYESIIRINSQSGKGGIAYVMEKEHGVVLPKQMHPEFASIVQRLADGTGKELSGETLWNAFEQEYLNGREIEIKDCDIDRPGVSSQTVIHALIAMNGVERTIEGKGNGPVDAFVNAFCRAGVQFSVTDYAEHALSIGSDSKAAAYVRVEKGGRTFWGVGIDESIDMASLKAIASGLCRAK